MFYFIDKDPEFSIFISGVNNVSCTGYTMKCDSYNQENVLESFIYSLTIYSVYHYLWGRLKLFSMKAHFLSQRLK